MRMNIRYGTTSENDVVSKKLRISYTLLLNSIIVEKHEILSLRMGLMGYIRRPAKKCVYVI